MKIIKEYRLKKEIITTQTFYITKNADVVGTADFDFDIGLFVICDATTAETDLRTFKICYSYETIYEDNIKYIGTVGTQHIIEIL